MPMKNPPHPGLSVRINCLEPLGLSVTEGAKVLGVSRTTLSRLINERAGVSPEMAIRLSKAFGSTPGAWIRLQAAYDIAQVTARGGTRLGWDPQAHTPRTRNSQERAAAASARSCVAMISSPSTCSRHIRAVAK